MNYPTFNILVTTSSPSMDVWWQGNDILYMDYLTWQAALYAHREQTRTTMDRQ